MKNLSIILIVISNLTLSYASYFNDEIDQMLTWSWDNCRDQFNSYTNLMSTFKYDEQLFNCAKSGYLSQYEKNECEEEAKINTKHDIVKNFYFVCVNGFQKFKNEIKDSCDTECFQQNYCKYLNQLNYIDYVNEKDIDCQTEGICNKDKLNETQFYICTKSEKKCCPLFKENRFSINQSLDNFIQSVVEYYGLFKYYIVAPLLFYFIVDWYKRFEF